jgi:hypothetical protein
MRHGSLFSGIGGFDLASEWMGWENVFHCEWMEFPRKVLEYYWPEADSHVDICKTDFKKYEGTIDVISGDWFSSRCALTWKMKGTKFNRLLFQLRPKTHRTEEIDVGFLPTPTVMDQTNATATMKSTQVKEGSMHSVTLNRAMAMGMLPTPMTNDWKGRQPTETWQGNSDLCSVISKAEGTGKTSQLNPRFVAEMMGFPPNWTELPFQSGETKALRVMATQSCHK